MTIRQLGANTYNATQTNGTYTILTGVANTTGIIVRTALMECGANGFVRLLAGGVPILGAGDGGNVMSAALQQPVVIPAGTLIQWVSTSSANSTCFVSWDALP
jgi:hypothetical protein